MIKELKRLLKHSAIYGLSNILGKAIGFIMIPIYTHYIPPADYGLIELLDITMNIIGMFVGLGIVSAVGRFYYLYDEERSKCEVISSSILFLVFLLISTVIIGYIFSGSLSILLFNTGKYEYYIQLTFITFASNTILEIPFTYIRANERSGFFLIVSILRLLTALTLNIYFVVIKQIGILGILYSGAITSLLFSTVMVSWTVLNVGLKFNWKIMVEMMKFGAPLIFNSMGMFVINWTDRYFLKEYASLESVGIYSLGYKFGIMISFLIGQPFFMIWSYRRFELIKQANGYETYGKIFILYSMLLSFSWLLMSIYSYEIVMIVADERYLEAYSLIPFIALGYVFREFADFFKGIFYIENRTMVLGKITVTVAVFSLISYYLFIPRWGALGASYATLITFVFMAVINFYFADGIKHIDYGFKKLSITISTAVGLFVCGNYLHVLYDKHDMPFVICIKFILLSFYPPICFLTLNKSEKLKIIKLLQNQVRTVFKQNTIPD